MNIDKKKQINLRCHYQSILECIVPPLKKIPVEYYYYLSVFKPTRIRTASADSTVKLEVMEKLKAEIDEYRTQTKSFLKEMEAKNKLIQTLEDRLSRKPDPKVQYMYT